MIVARFSKDDEKKMLSLHVKGHAGQAKPGEDIVCSAASILAFTLGQSIMFDKERGLIKYKPKVKLDNGDAIITARAKDDSAWAELLITYMVIQNGYYGLAHNYPQYVAVELLGDEDTDE